jgi:RNA polymerase sigma-70 factor (ECF subfamily)
VTDAEFQAAFDAHKDAVYRFAWRMASPADAEDITQDVFLTLLRDPTRFDPRRGSLKSFLLGIARNLALKRWRRVHRLEALDDDQFVALAHQSLGGGGEPLNIERGEIGELVGRAVRALPPLQREVIILFEYEELSLQEIARAVDSEIGTVKSRLHRGRENLRRMLAPLRAGANK